LTKQINPVYSATSNQHKEKKMAKYKVTLLPQNVWEDEIVKDIIALDAKNAMEIAEIFNKNCIAIKAQIKGSGESTLKTLNGIKKEIQKATETKNDELIERHTKAFQNTVESLKRHMNAVAWSKAKKRIPKL
jgi:hypothetical protein